MQNPQKFTKIWIFCLELYLATLSAAAEEEEVRVRITFIDLKQIVVT
jgi:hypothetical protein